MENFANTLPCQKSIELDWNKPQFYCATDWNLYENLCGHEFWQEQRDDLEEKYGLSESLTEEFFPAGKWEDNFELDEESYQDAVVKAWGECLADQFNEKYTGIKLVHEGGCSFTCHYDSSAILNFLSFAVNMKAWKEKAWWKEGISAVADTGEPTSEFVEFLCDRKLEEWPLTEAICYSEGTDACGYAKLKDEVENALELLGEMENTLKGRRRDYDAQWKDYLKHAPSAKTRKGRARLLKQKEEYWKGTVQKWIVEGRLKEWAEEEGDKLPEAIADYCRENYDWGWDFCA